MKATKPAFEWKEPPPASQKGRKRVSMFDDMVVKLHSRPNTWAKLAIVNNLGGQEVALNAVAHKHNFNGKVQTTGRKLSNGTWELYAKWIPTNKEEQ